ncbi:hypothetical protein ONE63_009469 [Megalurothrips usitatus]|uniref:Reverse transcriptase domain-containing protein n=1 Tax=Megalurothrips usitatus TaxID=439358 RepID=A0AAV7XS80_9NEOP|nr:hypothetical protein ONE63_009469 [Megalurothrips usitatus]
MTFDFVQGINDRHVNNLKIVHINAQSLPKHFDEFRYIFENGKIDIIGVSETFFKDSSHTNLNNYSVMTVNRNNRNGGGVAIYVRKGLKSKILSTSDGAKDRPEYIISEILFGSVKVLFACIYKPPHVGYINVFQDDLCNFITQYKYTIVCGDMNARFGTQEYETKILTEMLCQCNLTPVPFEATYNDTSILDVIACNCSDIILEHGQTKAPGFSAHDLIFAVFNLKTPRFVSRTVTYRDYKHLNQEKLFEYGNTLPWEDIYNLSDINQKVKLFNDLMSDVFETCIPLKTSRVKHCDSPWLTDELKDLFKERDRLRKVYACTKDPNDFEKFRKARNKAKQLGRNAKVKYFNTLFENCENGRDMWTAIHSLGLGKKETTDEFNVPADELIKHFTKVCTVKYAERTENMLKNYEKVDQTHCDDRFYFKYVTPENIVNAVISIKSNAVGVDLISVKFVKLCLPLILPVLVHIFNYSLQNGCFPELWKMGNIRPVPKVKHPEKCHDFRPVSILCLLSKALEKLVHLQVNDFVCEKNILPAFQSGFRKGHNTTTALIKVIDDVRRAIDDRMLSILVLLDMSKAFDCVHHTLLLTKLRFLNFSESVVSWFESYLNTRVIRVYAGEEYQSEWTEIETGVPQGSVLGPLLFAIYLFDLPNVLQFCSYHMYADDIQLYLHFPLDRYDTAVDQVRRDLLNITEYVTSHNLTLNVDKTNAMIMGSEAYLGLFKGVPRQPLVVDGHTIEFKEVVKNLGVLLDSTLSWNEHCNYVISKVFSILAQLSRNFSYIPLHIRRILVQALIFPHFDYILPLCTNISKL